MSDDFEAVINTALNSKHPEGMTLKSALEIGLRKTYPNLSPNGATAFSIKLASLADLWVKYSVSDAWDKEPSK